MATVPATYTFLAGEKVTASKLNAATKTVLDFLSNPPQAMVTGSASTAALITDGTGVLHNFLTEKYDTDNMVDIAAKPDRITIQTAGLYEVDWSYGCSITSASSTVAGTPGQVSTNCFLYSSAVPSGICSVRPIAGGSASAGHGKTRLRFVAGDYLQIQTQTRLATGTTAATVVPYNAYNTPHIAVRWVAP